MPEFRAFAFECEGFLDVKWISTWESDIAEVGPTLLSIQHLARKN